MRRFLFIALLYCCTCAATAQHSIPDSLVNVLENTSDNTSKIDVLNNIAEHYMPFNKDSALYFQMKALLLSQQLDIKKQQAYSYNIIGEIHLNHNEYIKSLSYFKKAYRIADSTGAPIEIANSINNMAALFSIWKQDEKALEYYLEALEIFKEHGTNHDKFIGYNNLGSQYIVLKKYTKAIHYLKIALNFANKVDKKNDIAYIYGNLAVCYAKLDKSDQAMVNYQAALSQYKEANNHKGISITLYNSATLWLELGHYSKAQALAEEMEAYSSNDIHTSYRYHIQGKIADSMGNYKTAISHYKNFYRIKDSLFKREKFEIINKMNAVHENKVNRKANNQLKEIIAKEKLSNSYKRNVIIIISSLLVIVLGLLLKIYSQFYDNKERRKKLEKQNQKISEQNKRLTEQGIEIEQQKENLKSMLVRTQQLDQFKKDMSHMLVHDLKTPLNAVIGISEICLMDEDKCNENWKLINNSGKQMLHLVNNILDVGRFEEAHINLNIGVFAAQKLIEDVKDQFLYSLEQKRLTFQYAVQEGMMLNADNIIVERVLVNLISNAIKYSSENSSILIRASQQKKGWAKIEVKDYGEGIPSNFLDKIFDRYAYFSKDTEQIKSSTGLGLTFCKMAIEAHDGEIGVESELGKGSLFWLTLPLETNA